MRALNNCAQYWDLISAAVDGALTPEEEQRLQAHLAECPDCRAMLEQLQGLADDLGEITPAPAGFADRVMEEAERTPQEIPFTNLPQNRVDYAPARQRVKDWWRPIRHWCAIAACCLLILGLGTMLTRLGLFAGGGSAGAPPPAADQATAENTAESNAGPETPQEPAIPADSEPAAAAEDETAGGKEDAASSGLWLDGVNYVRGETVENLPEGFVSAGELSDAQAGDTGLAGQEYFTGGEGEICVREDGFYVLWTAEE